MYCKKCGVKLEDGVKFCSQCGEHLIEANGHENIKKREAKQKTKADTKIGNKKTVIMFVSVILVIALVGGGVFLLKIKKTMYKGINFLLQKMKRKRQQRKRVKLSKSMNVSETRNQ